MRSKFWMNESLHQQTVMVCGDLGSKQQTHNEGPGEKTWGTKQKVDKAELCWRHRVIMGNLPGSDSAQIVCWGWLNFSHIKSELNVCKTETIMTFLFMSWANYVEMCREYPSINYFLGILIHFVVVCKRFANLTKTHTHKHTHRQLYIITSLLHKAICVVKMQILKEFGSKWLKKKIQ